ncbi:hypothetical protein FAVG1_02440 [Fusarium avenaceum]|nr:hypothetical protein FAVG1_02440 [Fusarium avenaceum]
MDDECEFCDSYFTSPNGGTEENYHTRPKLGKVSNIQEGAGEGCWQCSALLTFFNKVGNKNNPINMRHSEHSIGIFDPDSDVTYDALLNRFTPDLEKSVYRVTMDDTPSGIFDYENGFEIPCSSASDTCLQWIQTRLDECSKSHDCWSPTSTEKPTRLLEVGKDRLVLRSNLDVQEYATLSHRWGKSSSAIRKLLKENIDQLTLSGVALSSLSQTFRDAVDLCERLGIRYIWIDSLCIIQDDPQDWLQESTCMASTYANAFIGIFAGHAEDGDGGLYSDRYDPARTVEKVMVKDDIGNERVMNIEQRNMIAIDQTYFHCVEGNFPTYTDTHIPSKKEPLYSRGWVFQELHLSPRAVLFNSQELTWVCKQNTQCECGATNKNHFGTKYIFAQVPKLPTYRGAMRGDVLFKHGMHNWSWLVYTYSNLSLTFEKDRLPALSGMAKAFQITSSTEMKGDVYLAGLWKSMLPEALMWQAVDGPPDGLTRRCRFRKPVKDRGPPSWSWMCCDYTVRWDNVYFGVAYQVEVETAEVELGSIDRAGEVLRGHLVLRAIYMEEVVIKYPDDPDFRAAEYDLRDDYIRKSEEEELVSPAHPDSKFTFLPDYDFTDKSLGDLFIPTSQTLYCVPIVKLQGYWPFSEISLVLRRHARGPAFGDTPDVPYVYERIGICRGQLMFEDKGKEFRHRIILV